MEHTVYIRIQRYLIFFLISTFSFLIQMILIEWERCDHKNQYVWWAIIAIIVRKFVNIFYEK